VSFKVLQGILDIYYRENQSINQSMAVFNV